MQTKKLSLRNVTLEDKESIAKHASHRDINKLEPRLSFPYTVRDAAEWINKIQAESNSVYWGITLDDEVIGAIGIANIVSNHMGELCYWIGRDYWNKGYMTEALNSVVRYGFLELNLERQYAYSFLENKGSIKVLQRNGFQYEGTLRKAIKHPDGKLVNVELYSLLIEEYKG